MQWVQEHTNEIFSPFLTLKGKLCVFGYEFAIKTPFVSIKRF